MTIRSARAWANIMSTLENDALAPDFERRLVDAVARASGSMGGSLWQIDAHAHILGSTFSTLSPPDEDDIYRREFSHMNPIMPLAMARMREGDVAAGADFVPLDVYTRTVFYNEFVRRIGYVHELGTLVERGTDRSAMLFVARPPGRKPYGSEARRMLREANPHVRRALALRRSAYSPLQAGSIAREVLARDGWAAFDSAGRVLVFEGRLVDDLSRSAELRCTGGHLCWSDPAAHARWSDALRRSLSLPREQLPPFRQRTRVCVVEVEFIAVPRQLTLVGPSAVLVAILRRAADPLERAASSLGLEYGLTRAEQRVAAALMSGRRPKEIAGDAGIAESTVRSHVKSILQKSRQRSVQALIALALQV